MKKFIESLNALSLFRVSRLTGVKAACQIWGLSVWGLLLVHLLSGMDRSSNESPLGK